MGDGRYFNVNIGKDLKYILITFLSAY